MRVPRLLYKNVAPKKKKEKIMPRFFVTADEISAEQITIKGGDAHHIARSLRMAEGDEVFVSDGLGTDYLCHLTRIRDEECIAKIDKVIPSPAESPVRITLFMAYPKGDKMETVTQKAVELGVSAVVPFESSRCIKRPSGDKSEKITTRLSRIAEEAAKQCGRGLLPLVERISDTEAVSRRIPDFTLALLCYENERTVSIKEALSAVKPCGEPVTIAVIVGSEGGFSEEEARRFTEAGAVSVSLGKRILRCETAPDYALSAISYHFEL